MAANSNNVRAVFGPRRTNGSADKTIDFITIATLGNATDFGDATANRRSLPGASNNTRGLIIGGEESSSVNKIEFIEMASAGNSTDFGDLTTASQDSGAAANNTTALTMSGYLGNSSYGTTVQAININSLGNATNFGNLLADKGTTTGLSNKVRAISAGGFNDPGVSNVIESSNFETRGTFSDFGDLTQARQQAMGSSNQHGGLQEFHPRAPELYSPTGKVVPSGFGQGDLGVFNGGESPSNTNVVDFVQISTIGNASDFGDLPSANANGGAMASATRYVTQGDNNANQDTHTTEFSTKGNLSFFGDLTAQGYLGSVGGNKTRGINYSGYRSSGPSNIIDYCTFATIGNFTDFGDANVASYFDGGCSDATRTVKAGGISSAPSYTDSMEYVTTASTGNGTDFGNLLANNGGCGHGMVCNSTRGVFGGGQESGTLYNVIQYITIQSTGNSTDFGDLTSARFAPGSACNSTRGVFAGGETPSLVDTIDYITIASTGNAVDFGDLTLSVARHGGNSNGHGGLS
jgi:hypothetical protein